MTNATPNETEVLRDLLKALTEQHEKSLRQAQLNLQQQQHHARMLYIFIIIGFIMIGAHAASLVYSMSDDMESMSSQMQVMAANMVGMTKSMDGMMHSMKEMTTSIAAMKG
jgi:hypothetical protein